MNISCKWIGELVESGLEPRELAARLTAAGCAVDGIEQLPGGDARLLAEITSNRPDWLCHFGVAREVAALTGKAVRFPPINPKESGGAIDGQTAVEVLASDLCPRYTARLIRGITVKDSPQWLKERLVAVGLRPINNVVDVTNYILYEMNQPLHAFDFDLLKGGKIVVRRAAAGEKITAIDGSACALEPQMLVIADAQRPVAVAGVMGGADTEVSAKTVNVLLESAYFEPRQVRRTSRKLKLLSDSSYRFERGIDIGMVEQASARACELILEVAGGELATGVIDTAPEAGGAREVTMRYARCASLLGCEIPAEEVKRIFAGLGLGLVRESAAEITVAVPSFRPDLSREIDLIEEVVRIAGYERVPERITMRVERAHESAQVSGLRILRGALVNAGYHECVTDPFVPLKWQDNSRAVGVENPVDSGRPVLRRTLVPSLLEVCRVNRLEEGLRFFEINRAYSAEPKGEKMMLCVIDADGLAQVRGALERILKDLRVVLPEPLGVSPAEAPEGYAPGAYARLVLAGREIGGMGLISETQMKLHDLLRPVAALEIELPGLLETARTDRVYKPLPRFPGIRRDIALVVPEQVRWEQIETAVRQKQGVTPALESVYRGKGLEPGTKSVAFSFTYYNDSRSMTDDEANALRDGLVAELTGRIAGSRLR